MNGKNVKLLRCWTNGPSTKKQKRAYKALNWIERTAFNQEAKIVRTLKQIGE